MPTPAVEDDVFIGPNATFTNDHHPRSKAYPERYLCIWGALAIETGYFLLVWVTHPIEITLHLELTSLLTAFFAAGHVCLLSFSRRVQPSDASQADNAHLRQGTDDNRRGRSCEPNLSSQACDCLIAKS